MTKIDYEARVQKGIDLLDEKMPDWAEQIVLRELNIRSGCYCVTAQLSGEQDYSVGMALLGLEEGEQNDGSYTLHGFQVEDPDAPGLPDDYDEVDAFDTLNTIWKREIRERQEGSQSPS